MPTFALRSVDLGELARGSGMSLESATELVGARCADVELEIYPDGDSVISSRFVPPLMCGLDAVEVPRTTTSVLCTQRHLSHVSPNPHLAKQLVRAAHAALPAEFDERFRLLLSDSGISTSKAQRICAEIIRITRGVEVVVMALAEVIGRLPVSAWKQTVLQEWKNLTLTPGVTLDHRAMRLCWIRGGVSAEATVRLHNGNLITHVRIPLTCSPTRLIDETEQGTLL